MHLPKNELPVRIDAPGAVARQMPDFGAATGALGAEYFTLAAGTDLAPLLRGLDGDLCHAAHWGYVLEGRVTVTYGDGSSEICDGGNVFFWPGGHTVRVDEDAELVMFSPSIEHGRVLDHIRAQIDAA